MQAMHSPIFVLLLVTPALFFTPTAQDAVAEDDYDPTVVMGPGWMAIADENDPRDREVVTDLKQFVADLPNGGKDYYVIGAHGLTEYDPNMYLGWGGEKLNGKLDENDQRLLTEALQKHFPQHAKVAICLICGGAVGGCDSAVQQLANVIGHLAVGFTEGVTYSHQTEKLRISDDPDNDVSIPELIEMIKKKAGNKRVILFDPS